MRTVQKGVKDFKQYAVHETQALRSVKAGDHEGQQGFAVFLISRFSNPCGSLSKPFCATGRSSFPNARLTCSLKTLPKGAHIITDIT